MAILLTVALVVLSTIIALGIGGAWGIAFEVCSAGLQRESTGKGIAIRYLEWLLLWVSWGTICMTLVLPLYVHAAGWESFVGKFGWLPSVGGNARFWFYGLPAAAWIHGIYGACWVALATSIGIHRIPANVLEAALLAQPKTRVFKSILLPYLIPWVGVGLGISALVAATEMPVADLYGVTTVADEVYKRYAFSPETIPVLGAVALPVAGMIFVVLVIARPLRKLTVRSNESSVVSNGLNSKKANLAWLRPGKGWKLFARLSLLWITSLVGAVPLFSLFVKAGWVVSGGSVASGYSFSTLEAVRVFFVSFMAFRTEVGWSLILGASMVAFALPAASVVFCVVRFFETRAAEVGKGPAVRYGFSSIVLFGMACLLVIPGPVLSLAAITVFNRESTGFLYDRTLVPTMFALLPRTMPLAYFFLVASRGSHGTGIRDAARLDSRSHWLNFRFLVLPRYRSAILMGGAAIFLTTLSDVSASLLVLPPSVSTISVRLFGLMHSGVRNQEAGLGLITIFLVGFTTVVVIRLLRYMQRGRSAGKRRLFALPSYREAERESG